MNSENREQRQLANILINPRFQLKYVLWLSLLGLLLIVAYSVLFYSYLQENYSILIELSSMSAPAKAAMYDGLRAVVFKLAILSTAFIAAMSLMGILFTHRTAGPLHQFKRVFREVKAGKRDARIHLRPGDEFQEVAAAFNEMMDSLPRDR